MNKRNFASDNYAGVHPDIMRAMIEANSGCAPAYGADEYTRKAEQLFKDHFGAHVDVYFVLNGTAANVLGLQMALHAYQAIICAESAHINVDECGAPEKYTGCKLLTIPTKDGKITVESIKNHLSSQGDQHRVQAKVISITQATELGAIYTPAEIRRITEYAHAHGLYVHMDGARLSNAAAQLGVSLAALTTDVGIDILSFGGTKNGMMFGEAVVFFNAALSKDFKYIRKQGMQLISKMRFVSAQFIALLSDDLWLRNAQHANAMAQLLAQEIAHIPQIKLSGPVQANAIFAQVDPGVIAMLHNDYFFYVWDEAISQVRWMTSFATTRDDIIAFVSDVKEAVRKG
jgi:threonine aldolase